MDLLIRNGLVIDPAQDLEKEADVLIRDGRVVEIGSGLAAPKAQGFDAKGMIVAPGFIDLHVHLREPGREDKETIETGATAAAAGGFTSVCAMPNTSPVNDNSSVTKFIVERAREVGLVNVFPIGAITIGSQGATLAEYGEMKRAGIVAISDDGKPVNNPNVMRHAMEYAQNFGLPVIDHCEESALAAGGSMHEGYYSTMLGLKGINRAAEDLHVVRDILLAEQIGAHVHIAHLSTAGAIQLVRDAKRRGVNVTCEVTPHHLTLSDAAVVGYDTNTKMNPPLRSQDDVDALVEGVIDGTVDAIATDHAPHHRDEKMLEYDKAPFGIVGLETALSLVFDRLVYNGTITLRRMVELMSINPSRAFNLNRGTLAPGAIADVTIFDPAGKVVVDPTKFKSKSRNTPFGGWQLYGVPVAVVIGGQFHDEASLDSRGN
ncbi:MAG TPA: dihydroorotase [Blastocatellia bacterium]|nr:dihydroorotase [Blastocatellia bacterium]